MFYPGYYDLMSGGCMSIDDVDDLDNATRELSEEMGISGYTLQHVSTCKYVDGHKVFFNVYLV